MGIHSCIFLLSCVSSDIQFEFVNNSAAKTKKKREMGDLNFSRSIFFLQIELFIVHRDENFDFLLKCLDENWKNGNVLSDRWALESIEVWWRETLENIVLTRLMFASNVFPMFHNWERLGRKIESGTSADDFFSFATELQIQDRFYGYKFEHIYNVVLRKSALNRLSFLRWWL
jgi:hypothetical protein